MAPRKPAMYRAVFFDLDDTIFDFGQCSRQAFFQACRCCHWSSSEEAFTEFQRLDQMLWSQQKAGHLTVEQVIHRRAESMARIVSGTGCQARSASDAAFGRRYTGNPVPASQKSASLRCVQRNSCHPASPFRKGKLDHLFFRSFRIGQDRG